MNKNTFAYWIILSLLLINITLIHGFASIYPGARSNGMIFVTILGYAALIYVILKLIGYISKMVNSRNRINEKIIFLHVSNTEEICDLMHSFLD